MIIILEHVTDKFIDFHNSYLLLKNNQINDYRNKLEFLTQINTNLKRRLESQQPDGIQCIVSKLDKLEEVMWKGDYDINKLNNFDKFTNEEEYCNSFPNR